MRNVIPDNPALEHIKSFSIQPNTYCQRELGGRSYVSRKKYFKLFFYFLGRIRDSPAMSNSTMATKLNFTLEEMFKNLDIAKEVMDLLPYKDLLNMTRVCKQFEDIIVNFLWKSKYRQVEVIVKAENKYAINNYTLDDIYDVMNDITYARLENRMLVSESELLEFLRLNSINIEKLSIICTNRKHNELCWEIAPIPNLRTLLIYQIALTDRDIQIVMNNSPKLENLILNACSNSNRGTLVVGSDIKLDTLEGFKHLKSFTLKQRNCYDYEETRLHRYGHIHAILSILKVQRLCIDEAIYYPFMLSTHRDEFRRRTAAMRSGKYSVPSCETYPCEDLELGSFFETDDFVQFYKDFLGHYDNISQLTIQGSNRPLTHGLCIPKQFFRIANEKCKRLTKLSFTYSKISNFIPIDTLTDLTLINCKALSWMNFKQILSEMNLKSFVTHGTYYRGKIEPFTVSKYLRHFEFDFPERFVNGIFKGQFKNLTSFSWKNAHEGSIQNIAINFPNLQKLRTIVLTKLDDGIFKLTSLSSVKINFHINVTVLLKLLKHPTLQTLLFGLIMDVDEDSDLQLEVPKTNTKNLSMPSNAFIERMDFWLDLLSINPKLTIICKGNKKDADENVFTKLVKSSKFPPNRKHIKVGGILIGKF